MTFTCPNCGSVRQETTTRTLVRNGELREMDALGATYLDECQECGTRCKKTSDYEGMATRRGGCDTGNGGKSNAR